MNSKCICPKCKMYLLGFSTAPPTISCSTGTASIYVSHVLLLICIILQYNSIWLLFFWSFYTQSTVASIVFELVTCAFRSTVVWSGTIEQEERSLNVEEGGEWNKIFGQKPKQRDSKTPFYEGLAFLTSLTSILTICAVLSPLKTTPPLCISKSKRYWSY